MRAGSAARAAAGRPGLRERLVPHPWAAEDFVPPQPFDLVLSIGAPHAFGGLLSTPSALCSPRSRRPAGTWLQAAAS